MKNLGIVTAVLSILMALVSCGARPQDSSRVLARTSPVSKVNSELPAIKKASAKNGGGAISSGSKRSGGADIRGVKPQPGEQTPLPSQQDVLGESPVLGAGASSTGQTELSEKIVNSIDGQALLRTLAVAVPMVVPSGGLFVGSVRITLSCATPEAKLIFTIDGSDPTETNGNPYSGPLELEESTTLKFVALVPEAGLAAPVQTADYTINEICVDGGSSGDGTRIHPFGNIGQAIQTAKALGFKRIKFGPNPIDESLNIGEPLDYSGGWDASFLKKSGHRSVVRGIPMAGLSKKDPGYGWRISGKAASAVRLEGIEIHGGEAAYSAGLFLSDGASPTFTDCAFFGGPSQYGYGVLERGGASATFVSCTLNGGEGASGYGLSLDSAEAVLQSSVATAGEGMVTGAGVMVTGGKVRVVNSVVAGNAANTSYGLALFNSKGSRVEASTLWGGTGRQATALFVAVGDPVVVSSILGAQGKQSSFGIHHNYGNSAPSQLKDLVFVGCSTALYHDVGSQTNYTQLRADGAFLTAEGRSLTKPLAVSSSLENLTLGDSPWFQTPSDAPDKVVSGGLEVAPGANDAGGTPRTLPWSIGAWQINR